jgi:hypothetical protein
MKLNALKFPQIIINPLNYGSMVPLRDLGIKIEKKFQTT